MPKTILITGAGNGFGRDTAETVELDVSDDGSCHPTSSVGLITADGDRFDYRFKRD